MFGLFGSDKKKPADKKEPTEEEKKEHARNQRLKKLGDHPMADHSQS